MHCQHNTTRRNATGGKEYNWLRVRGRRWPRRRSCQFTKYMHRLKPEEAAVTSTQTTRLAMPRIASVELAHSNGSTALYGASAYEMVTGKLLVRRVSTVTTGAECLQVHSRFSIADLFVNRHFSRNTATAFSSLILTEVDRKTTSGFAVFFSALRIVPIFFACF
jgi:hypothetical protein